MMTVLAILLIIAIVALVVGLRLAARRGARAATRALNQKVFFKGAHQEGEAFTREHLLISSSLPPQQLKSAILSALNLAPEPPAAFHAEPFVLSDDGLNVTFACGTKLSRNFESVLTIVASDNGEGSELWYTVTKWKLVGGLVANLEQLKWLRRHIEEAVRKLDTGASVRTPVVVR